MDGRQYPRISWRRLEFTGVAALAVTVGCLFIGQTAANLAGSPAPSSENVAAGKPAFNAVDYATTGALKSGTVIIGPCDNKRP